MRIISDFHDYYDSVQATGQDQSLIYFRKSESIEVSEYPFPAFQISSYNADQNSICIKQYTIGFCGKIFPVVSVKNLAANKSAICIELKELDHFVEKCCSKKIADAYHEKTKRRWTWYRYSKGIYRKNIEEYFAVCAAKKDAFKQMFFEKHCPIFIGELHEYWYGHHTGEITYNGCLKDLEFYRLFDTYSAFQEISMFLGGLAVPQKEIPEVPDKIMVGIKGFDKWSFRTPPRDN